MNHAQQVALRNAIGCVGFIPEGISFYCITYCIHVQPALIPCNSVGMDSLHSPLWSDMSSLLGFVKTFPAHASVCCV